MKTYELNLTFKNQEDCNAWEQENIKDNKYNGEFVMMVNHESYINDEAVKLISITTI